MTSPARATPSTGRTMSRQHYKLRLRAAMTELREAKKLATAQEEVTMLSDIMHTLSRRVRATSQLEIPVTKGETENEPEV